MQLLLLWGLNYLITLISCGTQLRYKGGTIHKICSYSWWKPTSSVKSRESWIWACKTFHWDSITSTYSRKGKAKLRNKTQWLDSYTYMQIIYFSRRKYVATELVHNFNNLDIELKVLYQKCHMLSNTPHRSPALPALMRYWAIRTVVAMIRKIGVILMHYRGPCFFQFHLGSLEPQQILEDPAVPDAHRMLTCKQVTQFWIYFCNSSSFIRTLVDISCELALGILVY